MAKNKKKTPTTSSALPYWMAHTIGIFACLLPLIVFIKFLEYPLEVRHLYSNRDTWVDFFSFYKAQVLYIFSITTFCLAVYHFIKTNAKFNMVHYLLAGFATTVVIAQVLTEYPSIAFWGYVDRFEGTLTWLCYVMLAFTTYTFIKEHQHKLIIAKWLTFGSFFIGLIGTMQYMGYDVFQQDWGKAIILGSRYKTLGHQLQFTMGEKIAYGTLYNPNYVGSYVAALTPIFFYVLTNVSHRLSKCFVAVTLVLNLIMLVGSKSTAGLVATMVVFLIHVLVVVYKSRVPKFVKIIAPFVLTVVIVVVFSLPQVSLQFTKLSLLKDSNNDKNYFLNTQLVYNELSINYIDGFQTHFKLQDGLSIFDNSGAQLVGEMNSERAVYPIPRPGFDILIIHEFANKFVEVSITSEDLQEKQVMRFNVNETGFYMNTVPILEGASDARKIDLIPNEEWLTYRGYIWNRSMPLILDKPWFGHGADTFALNYPQIDLTGRVFAYKYSPYTIVDKIHNAHLLVVYNFGLFSYFLTLVLSVVLLKRYRDYYSFLVMLALGLAGIINDTSITYIPIVIVFVFATTKSSSNLSKAT